MNLHVRRRCCVVDIVRGEIMPGTTADRCENATNNNPCCYLYCTFRASPCHMADCGCHAQLIYGTTEGKGPITRPLGSCSGEIYWHLLRGFNMGSKSFTIISVAARCSSSGMPYSFWPVLFVTCASCPGEVSPSTRATCRRQTRPTLPPPRKFSARIS